MRNVLTNNEDMRILSVLKYEDNGHSYGGQNSSVFVSPPFIGGQKYASLDLLICCFTSTVNI